MSLGCSSPGPDELVKMPAVSSTDAVTVRSRSSLSMKRINSYKKKKLKKTPTSIREAYLKFKLAYLLPSLAMLH